MNFRKFILSQLASDLGDLKIAAAALVTAVLTNTAMVQWLGLTQDDATELAIAVSAVVAWFLSSLAGYYNRDGVREVQKELNKVSHVVTTPVLREDGSAGDVTREAARQVSELAQRGVK